MKFSAFAIPLIFLLLLFVNGKTLPVSINGHFAKSQRSTRFSLSGVKVRVEADDKILDSATTDKRGNFHLYFITDGYSQFRFACAAKGLDTTVFWKTTRFESDDLHLTFKIP